jgi:SAM-dependent methyltransferase
MSSDQKYDIKTFGDVSGDFNWQHLIDEIRPDMYTGFDISERALAMARARHPGWVFEQLDLVSDVEKIETFDFDVFMIRDVIQHIPIEQAVRAFDNLRNSNIKYIIV